MAREKLNREDQRTAGAVDAKAPATESRVYHYADLPARRNANGSESRDVFRGQLVTGERVSVHGSMQTKGQAPNPAHVIEHTELIFVREGVLEFLHDGKTERAQAGDVIFVAKGTKHQIRNAGDGRVGYVVFAVGGDAAG